MTHHMDIRMNQRGINAELVNLALEHGDWEGDRCKLDRNRIKKLIADIDRQRSIALRALDKGGVVVVEADGQQITTYPVRKKRKAH